MSTYRLDLTQKIRIKFQTACAHSLGMLRGTSMVRGEPNAPTALPTVKDSFSLFATFTTDFMVRLLVSRTCDDTLHYHFIY